MVQHLPIRCEALGLNQAPHQLGEVAETCNPSTQEVKAGAQKFRVTPGYTLRPAEVHETWQTPNKQVSNKKKFTVSAEALILPSLVAWKVSP